MGGGGGGTPDTTKVYFGINSSGYLTASYGSISSTFSYTFTDPGTNNPALSANATYFIAVMVDTAAQTANFYVNNYTPDTVSLTAANEFALAPSWAGDIKNIGANNRAGSSPSYFGGMMEEFHVYSSTFPSTAGLLAAYNSGSGKFGTIPDPGLKYGWHMIDGSGAILNSYSTLAATATLNSCSWGTGIIVSTTNYNENGNQIAIGVVNSGGYYLGVWISSGGSTGNLTFPAGGTVVNNSIDYVGAAQTVSLYSVSNLAVVGRPFDIGWTVGFSSCVLVYCTRAPANNASLLYSTIWNGSAWATPTVINENMEGNPSNQQYIDSVVVQSTSAIPGICYTQNSNVEVACVTRSLFGYASGNARREDRLYGINYNIGAGSPWGLPYPLSYSITSAEFQPYCICGDLLCYGKFTDQVNTRTYDGTNNNTNEIQSGQSQPHNEAVRWTIVKSNPVYNQKVMLTMDCTGVLSAEVWNGSGWINGSYITLAGNLYLSDTADYANFKCADVAFERTTGKAIVVFSNSTNTPYYAIWTPNGTGGSWTTTPSPSNISLINSAPLWIKADGDPRAGTNDAVFIFVDGPSSHPPYLYAARWNGSNEDFDTLQTLQGSISAGNYLASSQNKFTSYQNFDVKFQQQWPYNALVVWTRGTANYQSILQYATMSSTGTAAVWNLGNGGTMGQYGNTGPTNVRHRNGQFRHNIRLTVGKPHES